MPWYWTDEVADVLLANGDIEPELAAHLIAMPVAYRSDHETIELATDELMDDGEIPLAA
jgi:hypothetical protein